MLLCAWLPPVEFVSNTLGPQPTDVSICGKYPGLPGAVVKALLVCVWLGISLVVNVCVASPIKPPSVPNVESPSLYPAIVWPLKSGR